MCGRGTRNERGDALSPDRPSCRPNGRRREQRSESPTSGKKLSAIAKAQEGVTSGHLYLTAERGRIKEGQWLLHFKLSPTSATKIQWMYSDHVIRVSRSDKKAYDPEYPYQVVQVRSPKHYPTPPFHIDGRFRSALSAAVRQMGEEYIDRLVTLRPSEKLLASIHAHYQKRR